MFRSNISIRDFISNEARIKLAEDFLKVYSIEEIDSCIPVSAFDLVHAHTNIINKIADSISSFRDRYSEDCLVILNDYLLTKIRPEFIPLSILKLLLEYPYTQSALQQVFNAKVNTISEVGREGHIRHLKYILSVSPQISVFNNYGLNNSAAYNYFANVELIFQLADKYNQKADQNTLDQAFFTLVRDMFHQRITPRTDDHTENPEYVTYLKERYADPKYVTYLKEHYANHERIAHLLIDRGANVSAAHRGNDGNIITPREMAEKNGYDHLIKIIDSVNQPPRIS